MSLESPRVTIIIATYNWSTVLPYSIGSVLNQTYTDYEVLVVGDGCTDDSELVVTGIGDPRVRWCNLECNSGHQSGPNNHGLALSSGALIAYLGHDDLWLPRHLETLVAALDSGIDLAFTLTLQIKPDAQSPILSPMPVRFERGQWFAPTSAMHRKTVTDQVGGWRHYTGLIEDPEIDLWGRIAAAGFRVACVPQLTALKFPAAWRKNVYRTRPCEEQASWFERIRSDPVILPAMLDAIQQACAPNPPIERYRDLTGRFLRATYKQLMPRKLLAHLWRGHARTWKSTPLPIAGQHIEDKREFKGLDRRP